MDEEFVEIDVGGYEGSVECPNCGNKINIMEGNNSDVFKCERSFYGDKKEVGCGKKFKVYGKMIEEDE